MKTKTTILFTILAGIMFLSCVQSARASTFAPCIAIYPSTPYGWDLTVGNGTIQNITVFAGSTGNVLSWKIDSNVTNTTLIALFSYVIFSDGVAGSNKSWAPGVNITLNIDNFTVSPGTHQFFLIACDGVFHNVIAEVTNVIVIPANDWVTAIEPYLVIIVIAIIVLAIAGMMMKFRGNEEHEHERKHRGRKD